MKRVVVIVAIVVALSALGGTTYAAQDSLPGDTLYSVKLGFEEATIMLGGGQVLLCHEHITGQTGVGTRQQRVTCRKYDSARS